MKATLRFLVLLVLVWGITASSKAEPKQTTCPVMIGNPIDPALFVDHNGQRIYFCCKMCVNMFKESPSEYTVAYEEVADPSSHVQDVSSDHSNETDHKETGSNKLTAFLGKFHPVAVHLPIALFLVAALAELLFLFTGVPLFRSAARYNLWIAVPSTLISILLGLAIPDTTFNGEYAQILTTHQLCGFSSLGIGFGALVLSEMTARSYRRYLTILYRTALLLSALVIGATAHLGGLLVYGLNHFSW